MTQLALCHDPNFLLASVKMLQIIEYLWKIKFLRTLTNHKINNYNSYTSIMFLHA